MQSSHSFQSLDAANAAPLLQALGAHVKLLLTEAFAKYGATLKNVNWSVSAENDKGELVLSLWQQFFKAPVGNTIRYVDKVSRWSGNGNKEFRERLDKAHASSQPIRAVIARTNNEAAVASGQDASKLKNTFSVRENWLGKLALWDGDNFEIEFTKDD